MDLTFIENEKPFVEYRNYNNLLNHITDTVFFYLVIAFSLWRISKCSLVTVKRLVRGDIRSVGAIFLVISGISSVIYNFLMVYLSKFMIIDKEGFENIGILSEDFYFYFNQTKINLAEVLNVSYALYQTFKISALFLLIGLWLPCMHSFIIKKRRETTTMLANPRNYNYIYINDPMSSHKELPKTVTHASFVTFSTLYAFLRIPVSIFMTIHPFSNSIKSQIFYRSVFYGAEIYIAVLSILILETKFLSILQREFQSLKKTSKMAENIHLLIVVLLVNCFIRYTFNIISFPIEISDTVLHIIKKIAFITEISLYILLVIMFCPQSSQLFEEDKTSDKGENEWKPRKNNKQGPSMLYSEPDSPKSECCQTAIVEFTDYSREDREAK